MSGTSLRSFLCCTIRRSSRFVHRLVVVRYAVRLLTCLSLFWQWEANSQVVLAFEVTVDWLVDLFFAADIYMRFKHFARANPATPDLPIIAPRLFAMHYLRRGFLLDLSAVGFSFRSHFRVTVFNRLWHRRSWCSAPSSMVCGLL